MPLYFSPHSKECMSVCIWSFRKFADLHNTKCFQKSKLWCRWDRGWLKHFLSRHILLADISNFDTRYPYDIFPLHLLALLYSVLQFHHIWATCLKVCLKPMTSVSRSPQYYQRITANKVAPKLRAPRSKASPSLHFPVYLKLFYRPEAKKTSPK